MSAIQKLVKAIGMFIAVILSLGIIAGICIAAVQFSNRGKDLKYSSTVEGKGSYRVESFDSIDVSSSVANIYIKPGDNYLVETENVTDKIEIRVKNNGTLTISDDKKWYDLFGWFTHSSYHKNSNIYITVPTNFKADSIDISVGTGNVSMEQIITDELDIDGGTGDVYGKQIKVNQLSIDAGTGEIEFVDLVTGDTDINTGVGNVTMQGKFEGDTDIDGGTGNMDLTIDGKRTDFNLEVDGGLGSVYVNGKKTREIEEDTNAKKDMNVDGGVGDINLTFTED